MKDRSAKDRLKSIEFIFDGEEGATVIFHRQHNCKTHIVDERGFIHMMSIIDGQGLYYTKTVLRPTEISVTVLARTL